MSIANPSASLSSDISDLSGNMQAPPSPPFGDEVYSTQSVDAPPSPPMSAQDPFDAPPPPPPF